MPVLISGKVLVTGANGFIAGWIVKDLLEQGFSVRGTVRSADKAEALSTHSDRLEFAIVPDITSRNAFDEVVKGVDAIIHAASPVHISADDPEEVIRPAVDGTTGILHSASAPGSTVKRIVVVSSLAAIVDTSRPTPVVFTETDWNENDVALVKVKGAAAPQPSKYRTSKALAERSAWDFFFEGREKGTINWDLVTLCPPWVFGPVLGARTPEELNFSVGHWYTLVVKGEGEVPTWSKANWTDVRDIVDASRLSLTKPEAGGERFIICTSPFVWGQWVDIARRRLGKTTSEDNTNDNPRVIHDMTFDSTKSKKLLGIRYRSMEETAAFMLEDFKVKGWC